MKIAILTPNKKTSTETFIQNHITYLPFDKIVIYGSNFPYRTDEYSPSIAYERVYGVINKVKRKLGIQTESFNANQLAKLLVKENVEFVFAEYLTTGAEVCEVCKRLNIPIIAIALGYEISRYKIIEKYQEKYKNLFQYAKRIVVVSEHMKTNLLSLNCSIDKIVYSPAGPAKNFFEISPTFESKNILAIGRFVNKKAPHLTIMAFKKVLEVVPEAILVFAGNGALLNVCNDLVKACGIEKSVVFKGVINQEEQRELFKDAYMFVQHSKVADDGDSEGTPVAILEASAAGLPIVSTVHAGIPNVVLNNETGFLVRENDVVAMAEKMLLLLKDNKLARNMGAAGKAYVFENFTLENHIESIAMHIKK